MLKLSFTTDSRNFGQISLLYSPLTICHPIVSIT
nr:MAG TPA: hypothetical protein [Herelleviridae sp.]